MDCTSLLKQYKERLAELSLEGKGNSEEAQEIRAILAEIKEA